MATVSVSSTQISNRAASPKVKSNSRICQGPLVGTMGVCATSAADDIGSKYTFFSLPSNARLFQLLLSTNGLGTTGAANIGLYQTTDNGGAVVDADLFATAVALTAALSNSDITTEAAGAGASIGVDDLEKPIWEILGLTADPKIDYDVVATLTTATVSAGYVALQASYMI